MKERKKERKKEGKNTEQKREIMARTQRTSKKRRRANPQK
jgi:hypothetical protein